MKLRENHRKIIKIHENGQFGGVIWMQFFISFAVEPRLTTESRLILD